MSTVEDIPQIIQDFLAPELRTLAARLESVNSRIDSLESKIDVQLAGIRSENAARHEVLLIQFDHLKNLLDVDKRLQRLESRQDNPTRSEQPAA